jgi:DNA segregation ATPase FtsK/SpoIIIE, S-DNA-T family
MSTDHINDQPGAEVVALRAEDAATETRVTESPGPAYTDLSDGRAARKPVIPAHWRTQEAAREHVKLAAARHGHAAAYHGLRAPGYLVLTAWWALAGIARTAGMLLAWWHVPDLAKLERQAAADGLLSDHLRIHKAGKDTRTARGMILAGCGVLAVFALALLSLAPPGCGSCSLRWSCRCWPGPAGRRISRSSPPPPSRPRCRRLIRM